MSVTDELHGSESIGVRYTGVYQHSLISFIKIRSDITEHLAEYSPELSVGLPCIREAEF